MEEIQNNVSGKSTGDVETNDEDYKLWIMRIVKNIEESDEYDKESYEKLVKKYPHIKQTVDELIEQYRIFSVYDFESNKNNFNLSAYLKKISKLIE